MATPQKSDLPTKLTNLNRGGYIKQAQNYKAKHGNLKGFTEKYGYGYWANKDGNFTLYYPDTDNSVKGGVKPKGYVGRLNQKIQDRLNRDNSALRQLYGIDDFPKPQNSLQVHHKRKISQYAPFFEGATPEEARELARYAAEDLNSPLSNSSANAEFLSEDVHSKHHSWERRNNYTRKGFSKITKDGPFPSDFTNANLETRKYALNRFLNNEQPKIDANLARLRNTARGATVAGIAGIGAFGTAASAAETDARLKIAAQTGNPLDQLQAGISGLSLAADGVSYIPPAAIPASIVSTGADVVNSSIDTARGLHPTVQRGLDILSKFYQNGSKAVDTNGISSI